MSEAVAGIKEITSVVPKSQETEKQSLDAILVFGQGPVIEKETRQWAGGAGKGVGSEDVNFWSDTLAKAASELYRRGQAREIVVMGGRTGGKEYSSEAELIGKKMEELGVPRTAIRLEESSSNTLENIVNMLNQHPELGGKDHSVGILGSDYHIGRLRVLMEMFDIHYKGVFSAEGVVKFAAMDRENWDHGTLLDIENRLNMNEASRVPVSKRDQELGPGYYGRKAGEEQKTVYRRLQEDDVWRRVLGETPEYWIGYLGRLKDAGKARTILQKRGEAFLSDIKTKFQIDLSVDSDQDLLDKLKSVKRIPPEGKDWGEYVQIRIDRDWGKRREITAIEKIPSKEKATDIRVWFMRHAPTMWSRDGRVQGNVDTDVLPDDVLEYIKKMDTNNIPKPDMIVVSELRRTAQTAEVLRQYLNWGQIEVVRDAAFNERRWGILEGKTHQEVKDMLSSNPDMVSRYPYLVNEPEFQRIWSDPDFKAEGGESLNELGIRVNSGLSELQAKYPGKNIFLITHAGVLQTQGLKLQGISNVAIGKDQEKMLL